MSVKPAQFPTPDLSNAAERILSRRTAKPFPLVAIVGAAGKSTTGWLLTDMLEAGNREVASWLSSGVYVDHEIRNDELHAWELAVLAARAREIHVLVQEIPSVLASRLTANSLQVVITTAICGSDAACRRDEAAARDREAVIQAVRSLREGGVAVANADDLLVVQALEEGQNDRFYYALHEANPVLRKHLDRRGSACWFQDGWLVCSIDGQLERLVPASGIPASLDGQLNFQLQNALAATAAAMALGVETRHIRDALRAFMPDTDRLPGSCNVFEADGARLIVDQPRSTWALKHLVRAVRATTARRVLTVIDSLPDFDADELAEAGRLIGSSSGVAVVYADESESRAAALRDGLANGEAPPVIISRDGQIPALTEIRALLQPGDTALVLLGASYRHNLT